MTTSPPATQAPRRPLPGVQGGTEELKMLISAAALAATLGGWAALAKADERALFAAAESVVAEPVTAVVAAVGPVPPLPAEPLPTLRARPTPAQAAAGQLRVVAAPAPRQPPPRPVAMTRSSR